MSYVQSEETRKKRSESLKRAYAEGRRSRGHSEETKAKISKSRKNKCLGNSHGFKEGQEPWNKGKKHNVHNEAWREKVSKATSGPNHWNWQGGKSKHNRLERSSTNHKDWMKAVFKRDGWTCLLCGKHGQKGEIVAHHIFPFSEHINIRYEVVNGITLCRSCHCFVHKPRQGTGKLSKTNGVNSGKLSIETILSQADGETCRKVQRLRDEAKALMDMPVISRKSAPVERHDIV